MRIEHLTFVGGGVIVPRLSELALAILFPHAETGAEVALQAAALAAEVARGALPPQVYCQRLLETSGAGGQAKELAQAMAEQLAPQAGVPSLLAELAPRVGLRLIWDYPRAWCQPTLERNGVAHYFDDAIFYTAQAGMPANDAALFEALVSAGLIQRRRTLWVDYHSRRTSAAIRHGIDAALFVDARRFRRDLGLWDLLPHSP